MDIAKGLIPASELDKEVVIEKQGGDTDRLVFNDQERAAGALTAEEQALLGTVGKP